MLNLNIKALEKLCEELATSVMDDTIMILPKDRQALYFALSGFSYMQGCTANQLTERLSQLEQLLVHLTQVISTRRYRLLGNKVSELQVQIRKLRTQHSEPKNQTSCISKLRGYLLCKGVIQHHDELSHGNQATIVDAYQKGWLSLPEACDAISATKRCRQSLQLHQLQP